jgi:hypothetical protein
MGQVTIYLEGKTEKMARKAAKAEGVSLSKWVANRIVQSTRTEWPAYFRDLAGSWPDAPTAEQIRAGYGRDVKRRRI